MAKNTSRGGKALKTSIRGCLVKLITEIKPHRKTTDVGERVHPPRKERRGKENLLNQLPRASPEAPPGYQADSYTDLLDNLPIR